MGRTAVWSATALVVAGLGVVAPNLASAGTTPPLVTPATVAAASATGTTTPTALPTTLPKPSATPTKTPTPTPTPTPTKTPLTRPRTPDHFVPTPGVTINNPLGSRTERWRIFNKIVRTINTVPRGGKIRVASWNIRSDDALRALVNAHKRGVSVRVIMDWGNQDPLRLANPGFHWMASQIRGYHNMSRRPAMRSMARLCRASCEGNGGMMHAKFYLFDMGPTAPATRRYITMHGSANLTTVAAKNQWNDIFTSKRRSLYNFMFARFQTMLADHYSANPLEIGKFPGLRMWAFPWRGAGAVGDPVLNVLNQVTCTGATGGTGYRGHTVVRIAQTVLGGARGVAIATKLAQLKKQGCRVRLVFTLINNKAASILRAADVPRHTVAKDVDHDFVYETYLHLKAMTISGHYGTQTAVRTSFDGSHNWNVVSLRSDETFARTNSLGAFKAYSAFVDQYLFHPVSLRPSGVPVSSAERAGVRPWSKVQVD